MRQVSNLVCGILLTLYLQTPQVRAGETDRLSEPGPFFAGRTTVDVARPDGSFFSALLYYPAEQQGENVPIDREMAPYPAIAFGHGFVVRPQLYDSTLRHLATWGYFVIAPQSSLELFPSHADFAEELLAALDYLTTENLDVTSPLFDAVDFDHFGLCGHSMGGGAAVLAAAKESVCIKAVVTLAAAETFPSAVEASKQVRVPIRLLAGDEDKIVPPTFHTSRIYRAETWSKQLPLLRGGSHCGFLDRPIIFCDQGSMPRAQQLKLTRRLALEFFELYLKEDGSQSIAVWGLPAFGDPQVFLRSDPGWTLTPAVQKVAASAGSTVHATLRLTNNSLAKQRFQLQAFAGTEPFPIEPALTDEIPAGGSAEIKVEISAPSRDGVTVVIQSFSEDMLTLKPASVHVQVR